MGLLGGRRREAQGPRRRDRLRLETVLKRNPTHPGAIHLYIHAVEASTAPEKALPYADRLGALMPGAGHIVHMPAHIYYRVGHVQRSLDINQRAVAVDERYFKCSPSDPLYKSAVLPAQHPLRDGLGADGRRRRHRRRRGEEARCGGAGRAGAAVPDHGAGEGRAVHHPCALHRPRHGAGPARARRGLVLVRTMYHYARATASRARRTPPPRKPRSTRSARSSDKADYKPYEPWGVPAKGIVETAR